MLRRSGLSFVLIVRWLRAGLRPVAFRSVGLSSKRIRLSTRETTCKRIVQCETVCR